METATTYVTGLIGSTSAAQATDLDVPTIVDTLHGLVEDWTSTSSTGAPSGP